MVENERSDGRTLAEIIGALSAALVIDDASKATALPGERAGHLRAAMEDVFTLAQCRIIEPR